VLFSLVLSFEIVSDLGVGYVQRRAVLAFPFVLAALPIIFTIQGTPLFHLSLGKWTLVASVEGLARFASIALKSWISVQAAILLAASTPFPDLLVAMRAVRSQADGGFRLMGVTCSCWWMKSCACYGRARRAPASWD
jgi:cobalt/nickel transport system permease protein